MSLDATRWAWGQRIPKNDFASPSAIKITLLSMADRADEYNLCYPSIARLEIDTELNRKTIQSSLKYLKTAKIIQDTGRRKGRTKKVVEYRLLGVENRESTGQSNSTENGIVPDSAPLNPNETENGLIEESEPSNPTDDGALKQAQIRNSSENGIVPDFPSNEPKYGPPKQAQIRASEPISLEPTNEPEKPSSCAGEDFPAFEPTEPRGKKIDEWEIREDIIDSLKSFGVPGEFVAEQLQEFLFYWRDTARVAESWDSKFYSRCMSQWKLKKSSWRSEHETAGSNQTHSQASNGKLSSIERANAKTREYLAGIEPEPDYECAQIDHGKTLVPADE